MAGKIRLTTQELLAQSQEMLGLQEGYEELFRQSEELLGEVNGNWSEALSRNFSGKIGSVENGFRQIADMLKTGGQLAAESARTYESVDALLARNMAAGGESLAAGSMFTKAGDESRAVGSEPRETGDESKAVGSELKEAASEPTEANGERKPAGGGPKEADDELIAAARDSLKGRRAIMEQTARRAAENRKKAKTAKKPTGVQVGEGQVSADGGASTYYYIEAHTDSLGLGLQKLDEDILGLLKVLGRKDWTAGYEILKDVFTDRVDWDTAKEGGTIVKSCIDRSLLGGLVTYALDEKTGELDAHYKEASYRQMKQGNVLATMTNVAGSFADEILMGGMEDTVAVMLNKVEAIPGVGFLQEQLGLDLSDRWKAGMGILRGDLGAKVDKAVTDIGHMEQEWQAKAEKAVKEAKKQVKKVTSAVGERVKKVGDGLKKLLPFCCA